MVKSCSLFVLPPAALFPVAVEEEEEEEEEEEQEEEEEEEEEPEEEAEETMRGAEKPFFFFFLRVEPAPLWPAGTGHWSLFAMDEVARGAALRLEGRTGFVDEDEDPGLVLASSIRRGALNPLRFFRRKGMVPVVRGLKL